MELCLTTAVVHAGMHFALLILLAKYRRQPHINSGQDSDQRQSIQSVLKTMDADLSVSRRCFFEKTERTWSFIRVSGHLVQTSPRSRNLSRTYNVIGWISVLLAPSVWVTTAREQTSQRVRHSCGASKLFTQISTFLGHIQRATVDYVQRPQHTPTEETVKFIEWDLHQGLHQQVRPVAARGCLPPGANVCVAAPANQISSAIRVFVRISDVRNCQICQFHVSISWSAFSGLPFYTLCSFLVCRFQVCHFQSPPCKHLFSWIIH